MKSGEVLHDVTIHVRHKTAALWTSLMFCYVYGDYFGLYKPGKISGILEGRMGSLGDITQGVLLGTSILMAIPSLMVAMCLLLPATFSRWASIIFGTLYAVIIMITMPGAWAFYQTFGVIEIALSALIVWYAWRWPRESRESY